MQNFYKIINVQPTAKDTEIKKAIHETLRLWSNRTNAPQIDRRQEAERMVKTLEEAEAILLSSAKRAEYDKQLKTAPLQEGSADKSVLDAAQDLVAEGRKLLADGNIGDTLYVATKATERDGGNPEAWALLGRARFLFGDIEDAIYEYKRAIKLKPNEGVYYSELGDIYNDTGRFDDALTQYKRAAQVEPGVAWYRAEVGRLLARQGNFVEAVQIIEQCLKEEPDAKSFRSLLGLAYLDSAKNCCTVDPESGNCFPTSKAQVLAILEFIHKAEKLNCDDPDLKSDIERNKQALRESIQRKYDGSTGAAVVGGIIWFCAYGLGLIFLPFYFYASRPPRYAFYKRVIGQEATGSQKTMQAAAKVANVIGANENVKGGIGLAVIIATGLFLPVMAIVNYVKNYTGENDIKGINI
jgi:Flp pilus assembly protein TadD